MASRLRNAPHARAERLDVTFDPSTSAALAAQAAAPPVPSEILSRVRAEFNEMRGFSPTLEQMARLCGLPRDECGKVLATLLAEGFLYRSADGRYRVVPGR